MNLNDPSTGEAHTSQLPDEAGRGEPLPGRRAVVRPSSWVRRIDKRLPGFSEDEQTILGSATDSSGCG
ncbi:hypothetical protein [Polaromonas sp.]|uniref:hypothetical protein n=1 Tax=Polaromonas sp. TaxID=1869339 RepID=UPI00375127CC